MGLKYSERFRQAITALTEEERTQVRESLKLFLFNPRHPSLQLRKLGSHKDLWYMRATQDLRVTLQKDQNIGTLRVVGHHDEALKKP